MGGIIYFISLADYGMHLAFIVAGTFTYRHQRLGQGNNFAPMADSCLPVTTLMRN
jgi:hypothetical protein